MQRTVGGGFGVSCGDAKDGRGWVGSVESLALKGNFFHAGSK